MILGMIGEKIDYINLTKSTKFGVQKIYEAFLRYEAIRTYVPPPRHDLLRWLENQFRMPLAIWENP